MNGFGSPVLLVLFAIASSAQTARESAGDLMQRSITDFQAGRITESVEGFDRVAKLSPDYAPQLWQRGIALYYAGRYKDCRAMFELHRTVNPNDVEVPAWHFLCVARAESPEKAKAALLPVGSDDRVPMSQIYRMFRGELKPEQVLAAAGSSTIAQFYAHLYMGLYFEALGNREKAREEITTAAENRYSGGGYMYAVARVHRDLLGHAK